MWAAKEHETNNDCTKINYVDIQGDQKVSVHLNYSTKNKQTYFKQVQPLTIITELELGITDGVSASLVSINVRKPAEDTLNITCNFLYCNHQVHRNFLITLYLNRTSKRVT
jgi:hypothetical protein